METEPLDIRKIRIDGGTQPREEIDQDHVAELVEQINDEIESIPAADVFFDGANYWLADGFHRYHAHAQVDRMMLCNIRPGTQRDAVLWSVGANRGHGLKRKNADKRKAVMTLLADAEWAKWSDHEIARRCGVSHMLAADIRRVTGNSSSENRQRPTSNSARQYTTRHGTTATMNTARIGKRQQPEYDDEPDYDENNYPIPRSTNGNANNSGNGSVHHDLGHSRSGRPAGHSAGTQTNQRTDWQALIAPVRDYVNHAVTHDWPAGMSPRQAVMDLEIILNSILEERAS